MSFRSEKDAEEPGYPARDRAVRFLCAGHNQAVCKQTGGSIECPLNQWLACKICQQLVFPKRLP
ncbi:MAG: hypothetical protein ACLURV_00660 [Gallintestinimicrobium sp.]